MAREGASELTAAIGQRIREKRKESGWTLAAMAEELPFAQSTLTRIELGQLSITVDQLAAIANVFPCPIERLFPPDWAELIEQPA